MIYFLGNDCAGDHRSWFRNEFHSRVALRLLIQIFVGVINCAFLYGLLISGLFYSSVRTQFINIALFERFLSLMGVIVLVFVVDWVIYLDRLVN